MKRGKKKTEARERRWVIFNNGCVHGVQHSELVVVRSVPHRSVIQDSVSVFTISKTFSVLAALAVGTALVLLLMGCALPGGQKGGSASTLLSRPGHTREARLSQSDNPREPSRQSVQSEQAIEYVLPAGSEVVLGDGGFLADRRLELGDWGRQVLNSRVGAAGSLPAGGRAQTPSSYLQTSSARIAQPMPVRCVTKDRTETTIGAAQKDTVREWAGKAAQMRPVLWAGLVMMTLVAGILVYFGWWTKAGLAAAIGLGMIVLAQALPGHGTLIVFGGLGVFALLALLILYAYHKGRLDRNDNGIPDFLEGNREGPF
jgi:hypothetical protein